MKKLTENFNKITLSKGDIFSIELPSSPSSGYIWEVSIVSGNIKILSNSFNINSNDNLIGHAGTQSFSFKAKKTGDVEIKAEYKRPWENKTATKNISFKIKII